MNPKQEYEALIYQTKQQLDSLQKQTKRDYHYTLTSRAKQQNFLIGYNALNGRPIHLKPEHINCHWDLLGSTGKGKSKLIEHLVRAITHARPHRGLCLLDPHGDLYHAAVTYCTRKHLKDRVILIDPNEDARAVGINYLERGRHITKDIDAHVGMVMRAISKVFGGEDQEKMPRLQRWERASIHALMERGCTLVELLDFLALVNPKFRRAVVESLQDYYIKKEWEEFEAKKRQSDQETLIEPVLNRAAKFVGSQRIRRIVGQLSSTVNWREAMHQGKIILVNLSSHRLSTENQRMLGVMIIDMIVEAALSRVYVSERERKPFHLIIDECDEFLCDDIPFFMQKLRKFRCFLTLSHQELQQLKEASPKVYSAVMSNTDVKIAFGISREDAEIMAKELFTGMIRGDRIKDEIWQTKFWPHETTRTIRSRGGASSTGGGSVEATGSGSATGHITATHLDPSSGLFFSQVIGLTDTSSSITSSSYSRGEHATWSDSDFWMEAEAPFYEYEPFKEMSSRTYFTPQELLEKFISWIKNQTPRHAQLKLFTRHPIPIVTPTVDDVRVSNEALEEFKNEILALYTTPVVEIDHQIEERRSRLIEAPTQETFQQEPASKEADDDAFVKSTRGKVV